MTACEHRLLRLRKVTQQGKVYYCPLCGESYVATLTPAAADSVGKAAPAPTTVAVN